MIYGYARVSTREQNLQLQLDALKNYGVDKIFKDKVSTKKTKEQLDVLFSLLKPGDTLVIWKLDRLGRSLRELLDLVDGFEKKQINFVSLNEMIDTKSPMGRAFFHITAAFAQLERDTISMRTIAGLESAKLRGRYGGRPKKDKKTVETAIKMYKSGFTLNEIKNTVNISPHTLYTYLKQEIFELYKKGKSIDEIVDITSVRKQLVERYLDQISKKNRPE